MNAAIVIVWPAASPRPCSCGNPATVDAGLADERRVLFAEFTEPACDECLPFVERRLLGLPPVEAVR